MTDAIVVCADDYALTTPVSRAILALADQNRISALSCMTASPLWPEHGRWLAAVKDKADIGLHLTLVDEAPLTAMPRTAPRGRLPSIGRLIAASYAGALDRDEIAHEISGEITAQIKSFVDVMGVAPAHIDGHLHAHVLPGIRALVLDAAQRLSPRPWLRNVHDRFGAILSRGVAVPKAAFISALGRGFDSGGTSFSGRFNESFSGVYAFPGSGRYGDLFPHFVKARGRRHLILCHPGEAGDEAAAWDQSRAAEFDYLRGADFPAFLATQGLRLTRFADA